MRRAVKDIIITTLLCIAIFLAAHWIAKRIASHFYTTSEGFQLVFTWDISQELQRPEYNGAGLDTYNQVKNIITDLKTVLYSLMLNNYDTAQSVAYIKSRINGNPDKTQQEAARELSQEATAFLNKLTKPEDYIDLTMNGMPGNMIVGKFPREWAEYALRKVGNNRPIVARKYIYDNLDKIQAEVMADKSPAEYNEYIQDKPSWDNTSNLKQRSCTELMKAKDSLKSQIVSLRSKTQDLSGSVYVAIKSKDENMKYQYQFRNRCDVNPVPETCKGLASLDPNLFETLGPYDATNKTLFEQEIELQDNLDALNLTIGVVGCPNNTDLSGIAVDRDIGVLDSESLKIRLEELSPYYIAPVVLQYITNLLVGGAEIDAAAQTTLTNIKVVSTNIQGIRSISDRIGKP
jgi:hypothetical protein